MKNIICIIIVFVLSSLPSFSQNNEDIILSPFWDYYSNNYLNTISAGKGFTGIASESDITGFMLNPASIRLDTKYQLNVQYTFKSNGSWFGDNEFLKQQLFSGSAGFGLKLNENLNIGLVYNNPAGYYFGAEMIRTDEFGNEIGKYDYYNNVSIHSLNIPFSISGKKISAGLNLNYLHSRYTIPGDQITTIGHPNGFNDGSDFSASANFAELQAGVIFKLADNFSIGLSGSTGGRSKVKYTYPDGTTENTAIAIYPWKFGAGIQYKVLNTGWKFLADYNYAKTSASRLLKDRNDFHIGFENEINKIWTIRGGFFTLKDYRSGEVIYLEDIGAYDQFFFTAGFGYKKSNVIWNLAILSSVLSSGSVKNIYLNTGLTINLK